LLTLTKLKNFNRHNRFFLIVNFRNRFDKALMKIFQFRRALSKSNHIYLTCSKSYKTFIFCLVCMFITYIKLIDSKMTLLNNKKWKKKLLKKKCFIGSTTEQNLLTVEFCCSGFLTQAVITHCMLSLQSSSVRQPTGI